MNIEWAEEWFASAFSCYAPMRGGANGVAVNGTAEADALPTVLSRRRRSSAVSSEDDRSSG